jgi:esterase/lipase superfamily enzyme
MKLYCPESEACRSWTAMDRPVGERLAQHAAYERFIKHELVPFIEEDCHTPGVRIGLAGASLGATYAALFALKTPHRFPWALCLSGRYRTTPMLHGQGGEDAYYNDPLAFVPNLSGEALARVRGQTHLTLVVGRGPHENRCIDETVALSRALRGRGIPHTLDVWGQDVSHEWVWWRRQLRHHLGGALWRAAG